MGVRGWGPHARIEGTGSVLSATEERCFLACFRIRPPGLRSCQAALPKPSGRVFGCVFRCLRRVFWLLGPGLANPSFLRDVSSVLPILAMPAGVVLVHGRRLQSVSIVKERRDVFDALVTDALIRFWGRLDALGETVGGGSGASNGGFWGQ